MRARQRTFSDGMTVTEYPDADAVVGVGERLAKAYRGKEMKTSFYYSFQSDAQRDVFVEEWLTAERARVAEKAKRRADKAAFVHAIAVGDIVMNTWGYEQTNVDFYQVVATTKATITIRAIGSRSVGGTGSGDMSDRIMPEKNYFSRDSPPLVKRPTAGCSGGGVYIPFTHGCGEVWDGAPKFISWYG